MYMDLFPTKDLLNTYKLFWQYPVITEEEFYNQNRDDFYYLGFPWATIIDKNVKTNDLFKVLLPHIKHKEYYTCCQHIHFRRLIPLFKVLGIKILYTPHKIKGEDEIHGVKLIPCPLYAVNFEDDTRNADFENIDFNTCKRDLLFSFMGGYQTCYLTDIRLKIFQMEKRDNIYIQNTGDWHFNNVVYSTKQNANQELNIDSKHINKTEKYNKLLLNSRFSLCPSGSGPYRMSGTRTCATFTWPSRAKSRRSRR